MADFEALMDGFLSRVKQAAKADLILHRIGKKKNIHFVGGDKAQDFVVDRFLSQPAVVKDIGRVSKLHGITAKQVEDNTRTMWRNAGGIAGTVSDGKSYIDRAKTLTSPLGVRNVVNHEAFHQVPIIGKSESLAHLYGGLRSQKGKLSLREAFKGYDHLMRTRPDIAQKEFLRTLPAFGAIGGAGGYYVAKQIKKKRGA